MKYDTWHKEIVSKFASHLGDSMADFYTAVSKVSTVKLFTSTAVYWDILDSTEYGSNVNDVSNL